MLEWWKNFLLLSDLFTDQATKDIMMLTQIVILLWHITNTRFIIYSHGLVDNFKFESLLGLVQYEMMGDYYRYFGGLTTPACNEIVQWTVFTRAIPISARQVMFM